MIIYYITGAKQQRITRYSFSSLHKEDVLSQIVSNENKCAIREKLNIREKRMVLSVGQFIYRKGNDVLIKAASALPRNIGIYIIGGTVTSEYRNLVQFYNATNIHFIPFMSPKELKNYYLAADLFVLPTREDVWGLVINEAMACGLPIVTTNKCVAGCELMDNNGKIVQTEDVDGLKNAMAIMLSDEKSLQEMGKNSLKLISKQTIENMVKEHLDFISVCDKK